MHIALKIGLYAVGSLAFLAVSQQFLAPKNDNLTSTPGNDKEASQAVTVPAEKTVLNTKVSTLDLDSDQLKRIVATTTKDRPIGSLMVGTAVSQKMI